MLALVIGTAVSLVVTLFGTKLLISILIKRQYGQFIRQDGPTAHHVKRGTPTMGGIVIILASVIGWLVGHLAIGQLPDYSSTLLMFLFVGTGAVGFADDFIKISRQRSLGLSPRAKIIGQLAVGTIFAVAALSFPNKQGLTPASTAVSIIRDTSFDFAIAGVGVGVVLFVIWANFMVSAWSNAVNLTDGLDGLATGASMVTFAGYTLVSLWQFYQSCTHPEALVTICYNVRDPFGLAVASAAIVGACFGFLWWNAAPAQIFMGDTGALALGGALAGLSILTRTEFLGIIIGGLFVVILMSDVIQIGVFKLTRKRVFRMAPLHHHFELKGWQEITIVIRFWIIAGLFAIAGVSLFYGEWVYKL
ncbi:phospho-N-acetylmuramoyl-pentapeptide-transferase [Gleimia coleocanis DSM 15436]|uniref:Phospho-N-acetylmuramoyl-pentapeptide-transferase n=1 Tax=Gleimia coleocanis DSM 15436 TaxID=525245 RepID=C0VZA9_9ACTO|nr:phospho-N-acetylmuramoyl-pentapeptide-transferase [Gleimia coleocanis]EEH64210.1 phospho-N-acetylmuramoyl-pentapeptide-transferase [Gleimia coleocanis DSM 15436]